MRTVFADTFYWIALLNPKDQAHARAVSVSMRLGTARIVTTDEVLTEFLNYFGARGPFFRGAAARLVGRMQSNAMIQIAHRKPATVLSPVADSTRHVRTKATV